MEVVIENPDIYTKKGTLSRTAGDVDNIFKALGDNIFIFGVDDSQVTSLLTRKIYGQEWKINLILSLENRDNS